MGLLKDLSRDNKIVSIVGMAKNAGKTATLNFLIEEAIDEGMLLGITSTGRDGEDTDLVTGTDKPRVYLEEGALVSVPKGLYELSDADLEIVKLTEYHSTIGPILICKVMDAGYVQVAGPVSTKEQKLLCKELLGLGAEMVIIDGAIDRRHVANPEASDAVILATGAVVSRDLMKVVKDTAHIVDLYGCEKLEEGSIRKEIVSNLDKDSIVTLDSEEVISVLNLKTGLGASNFLDKELTENVKYIYLPGAFTQSVIANINYQKLKTVTFIVKDPTKIFMDRSAWKQYSKKGMRIKVLENINIAAITVNPYSPNGYFFDQEALVSEMKKFITEIPVINVRA